MIGRTGIGWGVALTVGLPVFTANTIRLTEDNRTAKISSVRLAGITYLPSTFQEAPPMSEQNETVCGDYTTRYHSDGAIDEIVWDVKNVVRFHMEQIDRHVFWCRFYSESGDDMVLHIGAECVGEDHKVVVHQEWSAPFHDQKRIKLRKVNKLKQVRSLMRAGYKLTAIHVDGILTISHESGRVVYENDLGGGKLCEEVCDMMGIKCVRK